jgi:hypothetical protein
VSENGTLFYFHQAQNMKKKVQDLVLPGDLGVSPNPSFLFPQAWGSEGVDKKPLMAYME